MKNKILYYGILGGVAALILTIAGVIYPPLRPAAFGIWLLGAALVMVIRSELHEVKP